MLTLSPDELREVTGYSQPGKQLVELKRQGFWRARRSPVTGRVLLERAHFESVSSGHDKPKPGPKLHLVRA